MFTVNFFVLQADNNGTVSPIEQTNATETSLQHLSEDCLLEIFSSSSLTPLDFCSLAKTCKRFKQITQRVFPRDYKIVVGAKSDYYAREYKFQSKDYSASQQSVQDVGRVLTNFGSYLSALTLYDNDPIVTNLVAQYCDDGSLLAIEVFALETIEDLRVEFSKIFQRLLTLSINGAYSEQRLDGSTAIQLNFDSLVELKVMYVSRCSAILENTFPKLERFSFQPLDFQGYDTLLNFIGRHKDLRAIAWLTSFSLDFRNDFVSAIGNSCKELEELTLRNCQKNAILDFSQLHGLTKLKMLDVEISLNDYNQLVTLLQALKSLEIVKISTETVRDELVAALSQLQNLRELHFISCYFTSTLWPMLPGLTKLRLVNNEFFKTDLLNMISQLKDLEELEIYSWGYAFVLKESTYLKIVRIVEERSNELTLKCRFEFDERFVNNGSENLKVKLIKLK